MAKNALYLGKYAAYLKNAEGRSVREKRDVSRRLFAIFQDLNRAPPCFPLAVIDFAKIEHVLLNYTLFGNAMIFDNAPVAMLFAVLFALGHSQKHAAIVYI